jgi:hypothetical protein
MSFSGLGSFEVHERAAPAKPQDRRRTQDWRIKSSLWHLADRPISVNGTHDFNELPIVTRLGHIARDS